MSHLIMAAVLTYPPYQTAPESPEARIMRAIALHAEDNGVAGVVGEQRKCPSRETIARIAGVHKNTLNNYLPILVEQGVLSYELYGEGRGRHTVYSLLIPLSDVSKEDLLTQDQTGYKARYPNIDTSDQSNNVSIGSHIDTRLYDLIELLTQKIDLLTQQIQVLTQRIDTIDTRLSTANVPDHLILDQLDQYLDLKGEEPPPPPLPADELMSGEKINLRKHAALLQGHSEALRLYTAVNEFPGLDNEKVIYERLGDSPRLDTLRQAVSLWRGSGNKLTNHIGICDWYLELIRDPGWTPGAKFKAGANGRAPAPDKSVEQAMKEYAADKAKFLGRR